jgi:hypothetical protein
MPLGIKGAPQQVMLQHKGLLGIRIRMQLPFSLNPILHRVLLTVKEMGNVVAIEDLTSWVVPASHGSACVVTKNGKGMYEAQKKGPTSSSPCLRSFSVPLLCSRFCRCFGKGGTSSSGEHHTLVIA